MTNVHRNLIHWPSHDGLTKSLFNIKQYTYKGLNTSRTSTIITKLSQEDTLVCSIQSFLSNVKTLHNKFIGTMKILTKKEILVTVNLHLCIFNQSGCSCFTLFNQFKCCSYNVHLNKKCNSSST